MSCRKGDALHPAIGRVKTCLDGRAVQGGTVGLDGAPGLPQAFVSPGEFYFPAYRLAVTAGRARHDP